MAISAIVVVIGAFLPWASLFGVTVYGIEGDGVISLVCALIGLAVIAGNASGKLPRKLYLVVSGVTAGVSALVGLMDMTGVAAMGLYLTMFAGFAWIAGLVWEVRLGRVSAPTPAGVVNVSQPTDDERETAGTS